MFSTCQVQMNLSIYFQYGKDAEEFENEDKQAADNILKVDVVGLMFIIFFLFILLIQFLGMIVHRSVICSI